jgi:hypothetical protein
MEANTEVEKRLRALARQRRRLAEALPGMTAMARDRLQAEVGRRREGEGVEVGLAESVPDGPEPLPVWVRGKVWLPWLGVAAAAAALVWMVRFPDPRGGGGGGVGPAPGDLAQHSMSVPPVEEWNRSEVLPMEEGSATEAGRGPAPVALAAPVVTRTSAAAGGVREGATEGALASPVGTAAGVEPARKAWPGVVRWRQSYQVTSGGEVPSFLGLFECVRSGDGLELRAADGTVFRGRVTVLPAGAGRGGGWVYEAQGQPLGWASELAISLQWDRPEASGDGVWEGGYLELPLRATLLWGGTNLVELRAEPFGDG